MSLPGLDYQMKISNETVFSLNKLIQENYDSVKPCISTSTSRDQLSIQNRHDHISMLNNIIRESISLTFNSTDHQPWKTNSRHFESVLVSKLAAVTMFDHACRGGNIEIMGMLVGTTINKNIVIYDIYELPVEGTETRVNAQMESYEYMVQYADEMLRDNIKDLRSIVGWYHSHPGYDCWLSNIDIQTQKLNQNFQDPYVAIVIDPLKSLETKTLAIGAFRTLDLNNENEETTYYELPIIIFESKLDKFLNLRKPQLFSPSLDSNLDSLLFSKLLESMKQFNTFNEMTKVNYNKRLDISTVSPHKLLEKRTRYESHRDILTSHPSSSSIASTVSGNEESDIDMIGQSIEETESLTSSMNIMNEFSTTIGNHILNTQSDPRISDMLSVDSERENLMKYEVSNAFRNGSTAWEDREVLQTNGLEKEYEVNKNHLMGLKLREYTNLRIYRDTFSL